MKLFVLSMMFLVIANSVFASDLTFEQKIMVVHAGCSTGGRDSGRSNEWYFNAADCYHAGIELVLDGADTLDLINQLSAQCSANWGEDSVKTCKMAALQKFTELSNAKSLQK
jgi:hypothetical protein